MVFNATFNNSRILQLYRDSQFYLWRKQEYPEKTTDLPQVTDGNLGFTIDTEKQKTLEGSKNSKSFQIKTFFKIKGQPWYKKVWTQSKLDQENYGQHELAQKWASPDLYMAFIMNLL